VVGRPRVISVLGFAAIGAIGAGVAADGRTGAVLFGAFMLVVAVFCLIATLRTRVWVDGNVLYVRTLRGYADPVRLDRLTVAALSDWGPNQGRRLFLRDAAGSEVRLDATNIRLKRLYAALAPFIGPFDRSANEALAQRVAPPLMPIFPRDRADLGGWRRDDSGAFGPEARR
jgi:hypothetical protein